MAAAAEATLATITTTVGPATPLPDGWVAPAVPADPERQRQAVPALAPFRYDGTIDGLRGVPVGELDCVDDRLAATFTKAGIGSIYDLLTHIPRRYIDRSTLTPIRDVQEGADVTVLGTIRAISKRAVKNQKHKIVTLDVTDGTGTISCSFFNSAWRAYVYQNGDEVLVQGRVSVFTTNQGRRILQMTSPLLDRTGAKTARVLPIYPQMPSAELTTWQIHRAAQEAVQRLGDLADPVPDVAGHGLVSRVEAYRQVHLPSAVGDERPARDRLAYDELLRMQLALRMHRLAQTGKAGITHTPTGQLTWPLLHSLPFPLTNAQKAALTIIAHDMRQPCPMHRLLQGDVGAGKTLVSLIALLQAVEGGWQGALMAPTEILATQHAQELADRCRHLTRPDGAPVRVAALTNRVRSKARHELLADITAGAVDIVVGTHALLFDDVQFHSLGLAVVDEQHRFGVEQRAELSRKGPAGRVPDMLVMTATPIPRTAAMTVFGDLDVVVLDELPPGRTPIATCWSPEPPNNADRDDPVWAQVRDQVQAGRQGYVVCPLVGDSETKAAASAETTRQELEAGALAGLRVGLVHGKLPGDEKKAVMDAFTAGDLDLLVATTVIEVGVNVPNATIIVILDPKSFGIAQLHQMRGRVGRGQHASRCVLAGPGTSDDTSRRLQALVESNDGFRLSEIDLDLRGPGAILGSRQHGMSDLRVASLADDRSILERARHDAAQILAGDPQLLRHPVLRSEVRSALGDDAEAFLTAS